MAPQEWRDIISEMDDIFAIHIASQELPHLIEKARHVKDVVFKVLLENQFIDSLVKKSIEEMDAESKKQAL